MALIIAYICTDHSLELAFPDEDRQGCSTTAIFALLQASVWDIGDLGPPLFGNFHIS